MKCSHGTLKFVPTPELTHHGKDVCALCGTFRRWVAKPETAERQRANAARIVALRNSEKLSAWEREFIASLDGQGPKVSPKQQVILERLAEKYV